MPKRGPLKPREKLHTCTSVPFLADTTVHSVARAGSTLLPRSPLPLVAFTTPAGLRRAPTSTLCLGPGADVAGPRACPVLSALHSRGPTSFSVVFYCFSPHALTSSTTRPFTISEMRISFTQVSGSCLCFSSVRLLISSSFFICHTQPK